MKSKKFSSRKIKSRKKLYRKINNITKKNLPHKKLTRKNIKGGANEDNITVEPLVNGFIVKKNNEKILFKEGNIVTKNIPSLITSYRFLESYKKKIEKGKYESIGDFQPGWYIGRAGPEYTVSIFTNKVWILCSYMGNRKCKKRADNYVEFLTDGREIYNSLSDDIKAQIDKETKVNTETQKNNKKNNDVNAQIDKETKVNTETQKNTNKNNDVKAEPEEKPINETNKNSIENNIDVEARTWIKKDGSEVVFNLDNNVNVVDIKSGNLYGTFIYKDKSFVAIICKKTDKPINTSNKGEFETYNKDIIERNLNYVYKLKRIYPKEDVDVSQFNSDADPTTELFTNNDKISVMWNKDLIFNIGQQIETSSLVPNFLYALKLNKKSNFVKKVLIGTIIAAGVGGALFFTGGLASIPFAFIGTSIASGTVTGATAVASGTVTGAAAVATGAVVGATAVATGATVGAEATASAFSGGSEQPQKAPKLLKKGNVHYAFVGKFIKFKDKNKLIFQLANNKEYEFDKKDIYSLEYKSKGEVQIDSGGKVYKPNSDYKDAPNGKIPYLSKLKSKSLIKELIKFPFTFDKKGYEFLRSYYDKKQYEKAEELKEIGCILDKGCTKAVYSELKIKAKLMENGFKSMLSDNKLKTYQSMRLIRSQDEAVLKDLRKNIEKYIPNLKGIKFYIRFAIIRYRLGKLAYDYKISGKEKKEQIIKDTKDLADIIIKLLFDIQQASIVSFIPLIENGQYDNLKFFKNPNNLKPKSKSMNGGTAPPEPKPPEKKPKANKTTTSQVKVENEPLDFVPSEFAKKFKSFEFKTELEFVNKFRSSFVGMVKYSTVKEFKSSPEFTVFINLCKEFNMDNMINNLFKNEDRAPLLALRLREMNFQERQKQSQGRCFGKTGSDLRQCQMKYDKKIFDSKKGRLPINDSLEHVLRIYIGLFLTELPPGMDWKNYAMNDFKSNKSLGMGSKTQAEPEVAKSKKGGARRVTQAGKITKAIGARVASPLIGLKKNIFITALNDNDVKAINLLYELHPNFFDDKKKLEEDKSGKSGYSLIQKAVDKYAAGESYNSEIQQMTLLEHFVFVLCTKRSIVSGRLKAATRRVPPNTKPDSKKTQKGGGIFSKFGEGAKTVGKSAKAGIGRQLKQFGDVKGVYKCKKTQKAIMEAKENAKDSGNQEAVKDAIEKHKACQERMKVKLYGKEMELDEDEEGLYEKTGDEYFGMKKKGRLGKIDDSTKFIVKGVSRLGKSARKTQKKLSALGKQFMKGKKEAEFKEVDEEADKPKPKKDQVGRIFEKKVYEAMKHINCKNIRDKDKRELCEELKQSLANKSKDTCYKLKNLEKQLNCYKDKYDDTGIEKFRGMLKFLCRRNFCPTDPSPNDICQELNACKDTRPRFRDIYRDYRQTYREMKDMIKSINPSGFLGAFTGDMSLGNIKMAFGKLGSFSGKSDQDAVFKMLIASKKKKRKHLKRRYKAFKKTQLGKQFKKAKGRLKDASQKSTAVSPEERKKMKFKSKDDLDRFKEQTKDAKQEVKNAAEDFQALERDHCINPNSENCKLIRDAMEYKRLDDQLAMIAFARKKLAKSQKKK